MNKTQPKLRIRDNGIGLFLSFFAISLRSLRLCVKKIVSRSKGAKNANKNNRKTICAIGLLLALGLGAAACRSVSNSNGANAMLTRYPLKGKVVSVNKAEKKAKIE